MEKDKIALIIGGTGGLGVFIVKAFKEAGYNVVFTFYSNETNAKKLEEQFGATGIKTDTSNEDSVIALKEKIQEQFGGLDAVVYGTGICEDSLIENMTLESWNHVMSTNLTGVFLSAKHLVPLLRTNGCGRFICIGSVMADLGIYGSCSYAASKAGMIGLVKSIALENAKYGVTANVISFGYIDAGMTGRLPEKVLESAMKKVPMKKLGNPVEAAKIVVDMCAPHTGYISGQVIRVNGMLYV